MTKQESAKVYVLDFHFESDSKEAIAKKKKELDEYFDMFIRLLEEFHKGTAVKQVFLRKH